MKKKKFSWRGYEYNQKTGEFTKNGKVITAKTGTGYIKLSYGNKYIRAHRIAYQLMVKRVPKNREIDHINGNITDNRIENLRVVTTRENQQNRKIHRKKKKLVGCYFCNKKWKSQVYYNGEKLHIGFFKTELEAHASYMNFLDDHNISYLKEIDRR